MAVPSDPARALGLGGVYKAPDGTEVPVGTWTLKVTAAYSKFLRDQAVEGVKQLKNVLEPDEYRDQLAQVNRDYVGGFYAFGRPIVLDSLGVKSNLAYLFFLQASVKGKVEYPRVLELVEKDAQGVLDVLTEVNQDPSLPPATTPTETPAATA